MRRFIACIWVLLFWFSLGGLGFTQGVPTVPAPTRDPIDPNATPIITEGVSLPDKTPTGKGTKGATSTAATSGESSVVTPVTSDYFYTYSVSYPGSQAQSAFIYNLPWALLVAWGVIALMARFTEPLNTVEMVVTGRLPGRRRAAGPEGAAKGEPLAVVEPADFRVVSSDEAASPSSEQPVRPVSFVAAAKMQEAASAQVSAPSEEPVEPVAPAPVEAAIEAVQLTTVKALGKTGALAPESADSFAMVAGDEPVAHLSLANVVREYTLPLADNKLVAPGLYVYELGADQLVSCLAQIAKSVLQDYTGSMFLLTNRVAPEDVVELLLDTDISTPAEVRLQRLRHSSHRLEKMLQRVLVPVGGGLHADLLLRKARAEQSGARGFAAVVMDDTLRLEMGGWPNAKWLATLQNLAVCGGFPVFLGMPGPVKDIPRGATVVHVADNAVSGVEGRL